MKNIDGLLLLNKPRGITSTACLNKLKRKFKLKKIGHGGTLDPLATGLLLVFLGKATKLSPFLMQREKVYRGVLELGKTSASYDADSEVIEKKDWSYLSAEEVKKEVLNWLNLEEQEVPPISAAKHKGKPLYFRVRKGEDIPVKRKKIKIFEVKVLKTELPFVHFWVRCSAGTYIRSLAHSLGKRLGCGAILTELTREECTPFKLEQAYSLEQVLEEGLEGKVLSFKEALANWPHLTVNPYLEEKIKNGAILSPLELPLQPKEGLKVLISNQKEEPLALLECQDELNPRWKILRGLWS
ncbi:MAG: tRNA pseudouridine55 synthase [Desulfonauticus sp.]|jgi:tRNA pseudouridine55 synthase|nr:tRNA pseudouridine55 synthase [Desulfonauticus sp.]